MKFYAAINAHSTPDSIGFANTWTVVVFNNREARDEYVKDSDSVATRAINRSEVTKYAANWTGDSYRRPTPFSGEYWGIVAVPAWSEWKAPRGYLGYVDVCHDSSPQSGQRLFS